jgi:hypothetical protein
MRSQAHRPFSYHLTNSPHLKHDSPRFNHRHPMVWGTLTPTHTGFRWLLGHRLIREDTNPDVATTADIASDGTPGRFNLAAGNPGRFQSLQTKVAKFDLVPGLGFTPAVPFMALSVSHSFGL